MHQEPERPDAAPPKEVKCDRCGKKMSLAEPWHRRVYHGGCAEVVRLAAHPEDAPGGLNKELPMPEELPSVWDDSFDYREFCRRYIRKRLAENEDDAIEELSTYLDNWMASRRFVNRLKGEK